MQAMDIAVIQNNQINYVWLKEVFPLGSLKASQILIVVNVFLAQ